MKVQEKKRIRVRIYVVAFFFLFCLVTILARAYQLQVLEKNRLGAIARGGYIGTVKLPPKRGTIYDRKGRELALSVEVGSVYVHPKQIEDKAKTAGELSRLISEDRGRVFNLLKQKNSFVWLKRKIAPEQAWKVDSLDLKGVGVTTETRRYYPGREIAAHLIGFTGTDNQGLEGIEKKYDGLLMGPQNSLIRMQDAIGRPFAVNRPLPAGKGMKDLVLTIDKDIQYKAQTALRAAVKKAKAKGGHCLVVEPETGELLAMAVIPEFNPNIFSRYKPGHWRNRTITDCFEPGSTIKAFLLSACLEERVVGPATEFNCENGKYKVGSHVIHDTHKHDVLSVRDIVVHSSNIGAIKIGRKLGYKTFRQYLRKFGFGTKTGIDLIGERNGFIRPAQEATPIDQATLFFGQGMTTTSLQLIMAMAAIANGGKLMRPYVVKSIVNESGKVVKNTYPTVVRRVLSKGTARKVSTILEGVVKEGGTGPRAAISGFRVAGKTGTSQKVDSKTKSYSNKKYVATFVGFVPADRPKLAILIMIDEPKGIPYGGIVSAPAFSEVGKWSLNYLRVNPQIRLVRKKEEKPVVKETKRLRPLTIDKEILMTRTEVLPNFKGLGMREVLKKGRALGLKMHLDGTGLAFKQTPDPGSKIQGIRTVKVSFRPPG